MLTDEEINKIADVLALKVEQSNREFWIEPERHYRSHSELDTMVEDYKSAKGIFWRVFLTLIAGTAIILAGLGITKGIK